MLAERRTQFHDRMWTIALLLLLAVNGGTTTTNNTTTTIVEIKPGSATDGVVDGYWWVFDTASDRDAYRPDDDFPSCLLVQMTAELVAAVGKASIPLFRVPNEATAANDTCVDRRFSTQKLVLTWGGGRAKFVMTYDTDSTVGNTTGNKYLTGISFDVPVANNSGSVAGLGLDNATNARLVYSAQNLRLFEVPWMFSYSCVGAEISLPIDDVKLQDGNLVKMRLPAAVLKLNNLIAEPFKERSFGMGFTHLEWDCRSGWPYGYVPEVLNLVLGGFTLIVAWSFYVRQRSRNVSGGGNA